MVGHTTFTGIPILADICTDTNADINIGWPDIFFTDIPILISVHLYYKIISINDSYRDKIMIGYYAYILDFCNSKIALCTNIFVCFM